ncbi:unnamed protein product [Cyprideis torosa]|uniref:Uncharacterized protein n=1 Tax=Cyprideis torosa TaxID=163714 RepID=A0A7R8WF45_9CRUS|nr:unnamed protein product [Cyprideis torosa]CAG0896540.1 unnamed protein product [Cyprideis torosa]
MMLLQLLFLGTIYKEVLAQSDNYLQRMCNDSRPYTFDDFIDIAMSLRRGMEFIHKHVEETYLDLQLGVRMAEAQLMTLVSYTRDLVRRFPESANFHEALEIEERLLEETTATAQQGEYHVVDPDSDDLMDKHQGYFFIDSAAIFKMESPRRLDLTKTTRFPFEKLAEIKETYSLNDGEIDILAIELSGDFLEESVEVTGNAYYETIYKTLSMEFQGRQGFYTCKNINKDHLDNVFLANTKGYQTTHIVLYLLYAGGIGCKETLNLYLKDTPLRSFDGAMNDFCADIYRELVGLANPCVSVGRFDIFLESMSFCSQYGYLKDFLKPAWIRQAIRAQRPEGCWGDELSSGNAVWETSQLKSFYDPESDNESDDSINNNWLEGILGQFSGKHSRVKRTEKVMTHGCLGHMTAMVLTALAGALRLILEEADGTNSPGHSTQWDRYAPEFPYPAEYPRVPTDILLSHISASWNGNCDTITPDSIEKMLLANTKDYMTTHVIMWLLVAIVQNGCESTVDRHLEGTHLKSVQRAINSFCADSYRDAVAIANPCVEDDDKLDIFMEIHSYRDAVAIANPCVEDDDKLDIFMEIPGFMKDFLKPAWIRQSIGRQRSEGCWGYAENKPHHEPAFQRAPTVMSVMQNLLWGVQNLRHSMSSSPSHKRFKRTEVVMSYGCLGHVTAVSLGALSYTLRLIIEEIVGSDIYLASSSTVRNS